MTESLKDTYNRVVSFYERNIVSLINKNQTVIIAAHGNSLRALCKYLFKISDKEINSLEIPTGNPMIVSFRTDSIIENAYYMDSERACPIWKLN